MKHTTEGFMKIAIAEARKGMNKGNRPFGSVIVKDGTVVARAHSTAFSGHDVAAHAELSAIRKVSKKTKTHDLKGCTIYATGEPCLMCSGAIAIAKISTLVIAANHTDMPIRMDLGRKRPGSLTYKDILREYGLKAKVKKGVLRENVIKLYEEHIKRQT
jgi:tRNA(Arg) A34 adenosine deaminase TadA